MNDIDNCHSKGKKSNETKMTQLKDKTSATPVCEVHFRIAIYELWHNMRYIGKYKKMAAGIVANQSLSREKWLK